MAKKKKKAKKQTKKELKKDWIYIMIPALIIILLIAAVVAIRFIPHFKPGPQTIEFHGFLFENKSGIWMTQMQVKDNLYDLMFKYNPYDVEDIYIDYLPNNFSKLTEIHNFIYITFDPEDENMAYIALAATDLTRALTRVYRINPIAACTKNVTEACAKVPIHTCDTTKRPVILLDDDPVQSITYSKNCLTITGEKDELLKAVQRVLFEWYKIIYDAG